MVGDTDPVVLGVDPDNLGECRWACNVPGAGGAEAGHGKVTRGARCVDRSPPRAAGQSRVRSGEPRLTPPRAAPSSPCECEWLSIL